jgi:hypothetical protein
MTINVVLSSFGVAVVVIIIESMVFYFESLVGSSHVLKTMIFVIALTACC